MKRWLAVGVVLLGLAGRRLARPRALKARYYTHKLLPRPTADAAAGSRRPRRGATAFPTACSTA